MDGNLLINLFHGGIIFKDAATGIIWIENLVSLGANETVMAKIKFEEWLWDISTVELKHLHSDKVFSQQKNLEKIAKIKVNLKVSQVLAHNTKILKQNEPFEQ